MVKGRNVLIADALHRVVQEEMLWPDDDREMPVKPGPIAPLIGEVKPDIVIEVSILAALIRSVVKNEDVPAQRVTRLADNYNANNRPWKPNNMANLFKA